MRTNIVLNDALVDQAMHLTGIKAKREIVNFSLQELTRQHKKTRKPTLAQAFAELRELNRESNQENKPMFPEVPRQNRANPFAEALA